MKVLVDTNVLLSAALRDRLPEQVVVHIAMHDECDWLVTADILAEYADVLHRPKFGLSDETLHRWTDLIQTRTIAVSTPPTIEFPRDPKDSPLLAAAIATSADYLVTGDRDLFAAQPLLTTKIVSVTEMTSLFGIQP